MDIPYSGVQDSWGSPLPRTLHALGFRIPSTTDIPRSRGAGSPRSPLPWIFQTLGCRIPSATDIPYSGGAGSPLPWIFPALGVQDPPFPALRGALCSSLVALRRSFPDSRRNLAAPGDPGCARSRGARGRNRGREREGKRKGNSGGGTGELRESSG